MEKTSSAVENSKPIHFRRIGGCRANPAIPAKSCETRPKDALVPAEIDTFSVRTMGAQMSVNSSDPQMKTPLAHQSASRELIDSKPADKAANQYSPPPLVRHFFNSTTSIHSNRNNWRQVQSTTPNPYNFRLIIYSTDPLVGKY